uniref:Uncharacterized protein n=1 Tax=Setaria viridis TaxID=4556 RepID=A0A4U6VW12_SETVI|nr:hypothetical protein SEVIR_2G285450v2 [Setaria viridis]
MRKRWVQLLGICCICYSALSSLKRCSQWELDITRVGPFLSPLLVAFASLLLMVIAPSKLHSCCTAPVQQWRIS